MTTTKPILTTIESGVAREVATLLQRLEERLRASQHVDLEKTDKTECQRIVVEAGALRNAVMVRVPPMNDERHAKTKEECERYCCQHLDPIVRLATFNMNRVM
ncbi:MAG TPA: hypothetical protein VLG09_04490 [Candidatus Saccharimonadales bacterium]|nr:hypothetical protein [Candidatus Saccharimonadales bacterium]